MSKLQSHHLKQLTNDLLEYANLPNAPPISSVQVLVGINRGYWGGRIPFLPINYHIGITFTLQGFQIVTFPNLGNIDDQKGLGAHSEWLVIDNFQ